MTDLRFKLVVYSHEHRKLTLGMLAEQAGLHPAMVETFVEYGLVEPSETRGAEMLFGVECIPRLRTIARLRRDIGVNLSGIGVILDLLDKIQALQRENEALRNEIS